MRILLALIVSMWATTVAFADAKAPAATGSESLGGQLLDDLPGSTLQPPTNPPAAEQQGTNNAEQIDPALAPPDPEIRFHPLRFDDVGREDAGQPSGPMHLVRAGQGMAQAEALMRKRATLVQAGQAQQQVVAQLDELIAELSKQCNCNCNKPGDKPPSPSQRSQAKPGKSGSKAGRGNAPARDSTDQLTGTAAKPVDKAGGDLEALVKHLWGHLPEREREQMMQSFSDEFLPKYELEIEQYYQRLSEENHENGAR